MHVFGRDVELEQIEGFLSSMRSGPTRLLLEGEAGIGKTTLWAAGVEAANARGALVLSCRPAEAESSLTYAGLADLLSGVDNSVLEALPEPQRQALEIALLRRTAQGIAPTPRFVFTAFLSVVRLLSGTTPVLLAVDDLQWLDAPSVGALEFVGRRMRGLTVGVLAAARVGMSGVLESRKQWFQLDERLVLAPVSAASLHRLIKERLDWSAPRPVLMRLQRACAGNAFYALETARKLAAEGISDSHQPWPIPDDVRELVDLRMRALPAKVQRGLLLAAAASQPTGDLLDGATRLTAGRAGIVTLTPTGSLRFVHPLYASAVYDGATAEDRRGAHAELAAREPDLEERARHLGLAAPYPDEAVAAELDRAAERARLRGASEIAAEFFERAAELTPPSDADRAGARALAAADHFFHAGALGRARSLLVEILDAPGHAIPRARALRLLALVRFREESVPEAMDLLRSAAEAAIDDPATRAQIELDLTYASISVSFDFVAARPHAEATRRYAELAGEPALVGDALAVETILDMLLGRGLDESRLARALELEDLDQDVALEVRPTFIAGLVTFYAGQLERARSHLYPLRARLRERGEDGDLPVLLAHLAWLECAAGELEKGRQLANEALETAALSESGSYTAHSLAFVALLDAHLGRVDSCRARVAEALEAVERTGYHISAFWALSALGLLELSLGDAPAAHRALEPLTNLAEEHGVREPIRLVFLPDHIEALIELGELGRARELTAMLGSLGMELDRPWALATAERSRALLLAAGGEIDTAQAAADRALAHHDRLEMPLELARTLIVKGQVERRLKQRGQARKSLEHALAICEEIGATLWAERARAELSRLGRRRDPGALTPTEEGVARLAASGMTNREIAAAAFMSEKTVEANLSRIYRKLEIRSRAQLGVRLGERG